MPRRQSPCCTSFVAGSNFCVSAARTLHVQAWLTAQLHLASTADDAPRPVIPFIFAAVQDVRAGVLGPGRSPAAAWEPPLHRQSAPWRLLLPHLLSLRVRCRRRRRWPGAWPGQLQQRRWAAVLPKALCTPPWGASPAPCLLTAVLWRAGVSMAGSAVVESNTSCQHVCPCL